METSYGVNVRNKFDIFLDEDQDPLAVIEELHTTKEDKTAKKKDKKQAKPAVKEAVTAAPVVATARAPKPVAAPAKAHDIPKDREDKENKPSGPPRRGMGDDRGQAPRERGRSDRGGGPRRGGFVQQDGDVPPRFSTTEERGAGGGFGDRFGEGLRRGRGGGPRGTRGRGRGGRGGFDGGHEAPVGGGYTEEGHGGNVDAGMWPSNQEGQHPGGGFAQGHAEDTKPFGTFGEEEGERGALGSRFRGGFQREFRGRGGPIQRGGYRPRGRAFERQSGSDKTGIKPTDKREGGGSYNWGTNQDELAGETEALNTTVSDDAVGEGEHVEKMDTKETGDTQASEEAAAEERQLTLDEWKALKAQEQRNKPAFNIRKPGEGEDPNLWKKLIPLTRETEKEKKKEDTEDEYEDDDRHPRKQVLNIEINFIDQGPRGGRGRFEGRGGRGDFRGRGRGDFRGDHRGGGGRGGRGERSSRGYRLDEESFPELASAGPPVSA